MDVQIEPASIRDLSLLYALHGGPVGADYRAMVERAVKGEECLVASVDRDAAAYSILDHSFYENGFIRLLYVAERRRRMGIGRALMTACESACRTPKLFTSTNLSNTAMQALLISCGYRLSGVIENLDEGDPELVYFKKVR